jgi:hypothetical protein
MTAHVYGIFHMVKKLFASGRFSRQGAFRACFYWTKRAAKTREENFLQGVVLPKHRQARSQTAHLMDERGLFGWGRVVKTPYFIKGFLPCRSPD